jgi:hypothetical protein
MPRVHRQANREDALAADFQNSASLSPPVVHVAFGTDNFSQALSRLRRSAKRFGIRDIRIYTPDHPAVRRAAEEHPAIMGSRRGGGYWMWKPYILLDTMDAVEQGAIIIYSDAAQRYIADPSPLLELCNGKEIVLFHNNAGFLQRTFTKRDCFVLMQADAPEYWDALQLDASIQIYRAGAKARSFVVALRETMRDPRILCDGPNICGLPNFEGYRDHRHDQSILTILAIRHKIEIFPSPKIVAKKIEGTNRRKLQSLSPNRQVVFEHHRCKNLPQRAYWWRLVKDFLELP